MSRLQRPCLNHPTRLVGSGGLCAECANTTNRGYGYAWSQLSKQIIERDRGVCQLRLPGCTDVATTCDHIVPKIDGGTDDPTNLQGSCLHCNDVKGARRVARAHRAARPRNRPLSRNTVLDEQGMVGDGPAMPADDGPSLG